jgi:anti-anti-sigma regulatory factor
VTISIRQVQGRKPVAILGIHGDLDASNYQQVIDEAKKAYEAGTRHILIDMAAIPFMASSGLVALHSILLLLRGDQPPDPEFGWAALHGMGRDLDGGLQGHVKLLNPQPRVERVLKMASFDRVFEIHTDEETAINSF